MRKIVNESTPVPYSDTALIIPYDTLTMSTIPPLPKEASTNATVIKLFFEPDLKSQNFCELPIKYTNIRVENSAYFNGVDSSIRISAESIEFPKILVDFLFKPLRLDNQVIVSKFDWGNPLQKSWEIAQYGKSIAFKVSSNGNNEITVLTDDILQINNEYNVKCMYDGASLSISINNKVVATKTYSNGIFRGSADIIIGAELRNDLPLAYSNIILENIQIMNNIPPISQSIFPAYDFLSAIGLNYTTILSCDKFSNSFQTLILPYDDITTQQILTQIEGDASENNIHNIAILNTNGYGPIINAFGNVTSDVFDAETISVKENWIPQPVEEYRK